jgi:predicted alpha/beta-hydrolase family hydrolase
MPRQRFIEISAGIGKVSLITLEAKSPYATLVLAHGAGAGMDHPFMSSLAEELRDIGITTVRFNFPFAENKKKRPDPAAVAESTVRAIIDHAHKEYPENPLFGGGKSFGGRMTSQLLSKDCPAYIKGVVFFGFPLHAPGKASIERATHLQELKVPLLFLQGTRDALAEWPLIAKVASGLKNATLIKFEGADHGFRKSKSYLTEELAVKAGEWIRGKS